MRSGRWNATWPFATLTADANSLTVRSPVAGPTDLIVRRNQLAEVRTIRRFWSKGLAFKTSDCTSDSSVFWTAPFKHDYVVRSLKRLGWPLR